MAIEWFRTPDWSPAARADFEARLGRARPDNRRQYLRIKGIALHAAGEVVGARELGERLLEPTGPDQEDIETAAAMEHLGDTYLLEDPARAVRLFREAWRLSPELSMTSGTIPVKLAELAIDRGTEKDLAEAASNLQWWADEYRPPLPVMWFRWRLAMIRLRLAEQDEGAAGWHAAQALALADLGPVFPRHGAVGVVNADEVTLARLRRLALHAVAPPEVERPVRSDDPAVAEVIMRLRTIGHTSMDGLWRLLSRDKAQSQSRATLEILAEGLPTITDPREREAIVRLIPATGLPREMLPALIAEFKRSAAERGAPGWETGHAIRRAWDDRLFYELLALAQDRSFGRARDGLVQGLAKSKHPEARPALVGLLDDPDVDAAALRAAARLALDEARPAFERHLSDERDWVRKIAARGLAKLDARAGD